MPLPQAGKALIIFGAVVVLAGVLLTLAGRIPFLGRLPGDIVWKRDNFTLYVPLATSLVLSILVTLIMYLISRFSGR